MARARRSAGAASILGRSASDVRGGDRARGRPSRSRPAAFSRNAVGRRRSSLRDEQVRGSGGVGAPDLRRCRSSRARRQGPAPPRGPSPSSAGRRAPRARIAAPARASVRVAGRELLERRARRRRRASPRRAGATGRPRSAESERCLPVEVGQAEVGRRVGLVEPGRARQRAARAGSPAPAAGEPQRDGSAVAERLGARGRASLLDADPLVERHVGEDLASRRSASATVSFADPLALAQAEQQLLRVLREEAGARLHDLRDAAARSVSTVTRAPTASRLLFVPGAAASGRADGERSSREVVAEEPELRRRARRHHREVGVAVLVVVENGEGAAVLVEVEAHRARDVVEAAPGRRSAGTRCAGGWPASRAASRRLIARQASS